MRTRHLLRSGTTPAADFQAAPARSATTSSTTSACGSGVTRAARSAATAQVRTQQPRTAPPAGPSRYQPPQYWLTREGHTIVTPVPGKSDVTRVQLYPASALLWMFTNHVNSVTHWLSVQDLWICLICGHVGCGRYRAKHSIDHWKDSGHVYALELETQRVWDYVGDGYVHRLIQSKTDGKLVEVPSPAPAAASSRAATEDSCSSYALAQLGSWLCSQCDKGQSACSHRRLPIT